MMPFAIAPADMNMFGAETKVVPVGLNFVTFCTPDKMAAILRSAFEQRASVYCLCVHHNATGRQPCIYEGCMNLTWTSGPDSAAELGFTIDGAGYTVPVHEITQLMVTLKNGREFCA